ncbi:MAG TPA: T9SS type A sorting domain-containing protein, partial [Flavobacteriales bacterium]|nr:T9SS type A sorting domain-containing protein [Flavobacteriales bacterium]
LASPLMAQYCEPDVFGLGTEPICHVAFADISNDSPSGTESPAYEDFTTIVAHLVPGTTYTVTIRGNTAGTPPNHLAMNFDWDLDYTFETHVELDDLAGGDCDTDASGSFTVPLNATLGNSRVRIVKTFSYGADDDGCMWYSSYGQAEDYTVNVNSTTSGIAAVDGRAFGAYPNPTTGNFTLTNNGADPVVDIRVLDMTGRLVHAERAVFAPGTGHDLQLANILSPGSYSLVALSGGVVSTVRLIVQ